MAAPTLTPTSAVSADAPKLIKKASDIKSPAQTKFGCSTSLSQLMSGQSLLTQP